MTLPLLVILVPVLFGLMGFALDLGRLYLIRGELNQAASAMALAAASQLIGTSAALGNATTAAAQSLDNTNGLANRYNFGSLVIGQSNGTLTSTVNAPAYFATIADASDPNGAQAGGPTARHVLISLTADAPLLFWRLLPIAPGSHTPVAAQAVAGISAPLCTACNIEPFAIAAIDPTDTVNFGFGDPAAGTVYTFAAGCIGTPAPISLPGGGPVLTYVVLNRFDTASATLDVSQQLYRAGAQGVVTSTSPNPTGSAVPLACFGINDPGETIWPSAVPNSCAAGTNAGVVDALCGLYSRFDNTAPPAVCGTDVTDLADLASASQPDPFPAALGTLYADYAGPGRTVITVPVVSEVNPDFLNPMTVLGFRQFLLMLGTSGDPTTAIDPGDTFGRFLAQYIGSPAPVRAGYIDDRFQLGCPAPVTSGPGKVVLHR